MKKMYKYLTLIPIILLGINFSAFAQTVTFSATGSIQTYTVPTGVTYVVIDAKGASGGDYAYSFSPVGLGGEMVGTLPVVGGQLLYVYVGGQGSTGTYFGGATGGWNGGGNTTSSGGSGGGGSDVRAGGTALANRMIVAGGGGGTGNACYYSGFETGGAGGGLTAEDGFDNSSPYPPAAGGDQVSGNALGVGGDAAPGTDGGAAGGGYWGGIGGATTGCTTYYYYGGNFASGGGGGSSYSDPTMTAVTTTPGVNTGDGVITICAPGTAGSIISSNVCVGSSVTFTNPTATGTLSWSSSNTLIATVNPTTGLVTGVSAGSVTIICNATTPCGSATATAVITVNPLPKPITGTFVICPGDVKTLADLTTPGTWTSNNTAAVTVNSVTGTETGIAPGVAIVTYTLPVTGCYVSQTIVVNSVPLPIVGPANACKGYPTAYTDPTPFGSWTSSLPAAGTIDFTTGVLTGVALGTTNVVYTVAGCSVSLAVKINPPGFTITGIDTICQGNSTPLSEFATWGTWSSQFPSVATVDPTGLVTGVAGGVDTIHYATLGCPDMLFPMDITTLTPITGISSACTGMAIALTDTTTGGSWSTSDPTVALISSTGVLTAAYPYMEGAMATIYYALPSGCLTSFPVVVNDPPAPIVGADSVCLGASTTESDITSGGTWSSTNLSIAQIDAITGVTTGLLTGIVNISYTMPSGCFDAKPFLVETPVPATTGLQYFSNNFTRIHPDTVCLGDTLVFTTTAANAGTPTFTWTKFGVPQTPNSVTNDTFSYIPIHGDVIAVTMLTSGVCATSGSVTDSVTINVDSNKSPSIVISKSLAGNTLDYLGEVVTFYSVTYYGGPVAGYQWFVNGDTVKGATSSSYAATIYGTETVYCEVTASPWLCRTSPISAQSQPITISDYLNVNQVSSGNMLSLFPNPNNGVLTLSGTVDMNTTSDLSLEVTDMLGQVVYRGTATPVKGAVKTQINLGNTIADGTYLLHVNSASGNQVFHFVVNKQ